MRQLAQEAADALEGLGATGREVATFLRLAGFKGRPVNGRDCPCGRCLREHFGVEVIVGTARVYIPGRRTSAPLPSGVMQFVEQFDNGRYKGLIDD